LPGSSGEWKTNRKGRREEENEKMNRMKENRREEQTNQNLVSKIIGLLWFPLDIIPKKLDVVLTKMIFSVLVGKTTDGHLLVKFLPVRSDETLDDLGVEGHSVRMGWRRVLHTLMNPICLGQPGKTVMPLRAT
jgi:hypothetical protein